MKSQYPLGLPKGSVRAILAIVIVFGAMAFFLLYQDIPTSLAGIVGMVLGTYFGYRMGQGSDETMYENVYIENNASTEDEE